MRAGEFRHRLTMLVESEQSDGQDGYDDSESTLRRRIPAQIVPLAGRELERARQIDPRAAHEVKVRYWAGYQETRIPGLLFVWHDGSYDKSLTPIEPFREIEPRQTLAVVVREA